MSRVAELLHKGVTQALADGRCTVDEVEERIWAEHGAELSEAWEVLARQGTRDRVRRLLRTLAGDDDEHGGRLRIPGLNLPSAIAVRTGDGAVYYVAAGRATWPEVLAGLQERRDHIAHAIAKHDLYERSTNRLRPIMEDDHSITVAEALCREAAAGKRDELAAAAASAAAAAADPPSRRSDRLASRTRRRQPAAGQMELLPPSTPRPAA